MCYLSNMTKEQIAEVLDRVRTWPEERQAWAAELLLLLEAQDERPLRVSDEEWEAIQEGNAQAERGEFVSDEDIAAVYKRYGL
jgi:predicted transcriptional regulator